MTIRLLTQVSAFVLLATLPALAQTPKTDAAITDAVQTATDNAKEAYEKIKAALISETEENTESTEANYVTIDTRMTALGILGKPVVNNSADSLGTTEDIILNSDGKADAIIITHGGYFKFGSKMAAFDYDLVMRRESDGDVVMPLSTETVAKAMGFSYDRKDADDKTRVMSSTGMSIKELLKGTLVDHTGKVVAKTENVYFKDGHASRVIFSFDETMGMGGEKVIMDYNLLKLAQTDGVYQFKMSEKQSAQFERFAKAAVK